MSARPLSMLAAALLGALLAAPAQAGEWQLHGFAAQGWTLSEGNNLNGESQNGGGSFDFREIGLNASWRPTPRGLLAAQVASVQQGEVTEEDLTLDYLLADFVVFQGPRKRVGLRGGKLKLPFGFYNDSRDAIFSRPSVLLPQSVYLDNDGARAFGYFSSWGASVYGDFYTGAHALNWQLQALVDSRLEDTAAISILRNPSRGRFRIEDGATLRLGDDIGGGRWRIALTLGTAGLRYSPQDEQVFDMAGDFRLDQLFLSAEHNRERISWTAEIVRRRIRLDDLISHPAVSSQIDQDSVGFYLQSVYRLSERWSLLARYDERQRELQDRGGQRQSRETGLPRHYFFGRDFTLGAQYSPRPQWGVWAEVHIVDGALWVNPLDNPDYASGAAERHWSALTLMAAWRF